MRWIRILSLFPELECYGCAHGEWQYVVTKNEDTFECVASVKGRASLGKANILGKFNSLEEAKQACQTHYTKGMTHDKNRT